jgi:hypothetical protein
MTHPFAGLVSANDPSLREARVVPYVDRLDEEVRHIWRRARRWDDWPAMFDPDAAELRGPAERLMKAAFRPVAGGFDEARIARVREILENALHEISELGR